MNLAVRGDDLGMRGQTARAAFGVGVMGRAIMAISGTAAALLPNALAAFWRELTRDVLRPYRPELHYMRGPGPAWRAKNGDQRAA
jgi:hypothetical protein